MNRTVNVMKINRDTREIMLDDGSVLPMVTLSNADADDVDMEDATFATVQLPDGGWIAVMFEDFETRAPN